jgi:hypothetical protein
MKVKDLKKFLSNCNDEAYVHIQTDERFEEDIKDIHQYENPEYETLVLSSLTQWKNSSNRRKIERVKQIYVKAYELE